MNRHPQAVRLEDGKTGTLARRFSLASLAAAAFAVFALASAPSAAAQETLAASCPPPETDTYFPDTPVAQNFTAQASGNLTRAEISLVRNAGTDEPFTVQIWTADTDGDPVTLLATGTIAAANVPEAPDDPALVSVVFPAPAAIVAGQQYAIVVQREGDGYQIGFREDVECPGTFRELSGDEWVELGIDMVFRVFVTPPGGAPPTCKGKPATIVGTDGDNEITGTNGRDVIVGLGGDDEIFGLDSRDIICGSGGKDRIKGQGGNDVLKGNRGADVLKGGSGDDKLKGNRGRDRLRGGSGDDRCGGGKGDDSAKRCEVEKSI